MQVAPSSFLQNSFWTIKGSVGNAVPAILLTLWQWWRAYVCLAWTKALYRLMVNRWLSEQLNQGKSWPIPLPKLKQNETDTQPLSALPSCWVFCWVDAIPLHQSHGREQSREMMDWPMAWGQSHATEPVSATCHSLSSCWCTSFPLTLALDHGNKFLPRSLPGLMAAQLSLCTGCIPATCWAWAKPCPGGRQGYLGEAFMLTQQQDLERVARLTASDAHWQLTVAYGNNPPAQTQCCKLSQLFRDEWQPGELPAEGRR